jgi:hypothetical protein
MAIFHSNFDEVISLVEFMGEVIFDVLSPQWGLKNGRQVLEKLIIYKTFFFY